MKAIRDLIPNNNLRMAAGGILVFCGILDLSFGAAYVNAGNFLQLQPMGSLTASTQGVKSVGGFMIVSGIGLSLATGFIFWDLSKNQANKTLSFITWILGIVVLLLNFTCGVLTAQVYTPAAAVLRQLGMSPSAVGGGVGNALNFAAAVAVFSFLTGYPASLFLLAVVNAHREKITKGGGEEDALSNPVAGQQQNVPPVPQMQESQVQQLHQSYNYNYQEGVPQPLSQSFKESQRGHSGFQVDMSYSSPKKEVQVEVSGGQVQPELRGVESNAAQNSVPVIRQIEIENSSYG